MGGVPDIRDFRGRGVLLLQGPVGPFFDRFAQDLLAIGATVHKINFNGGDHHFSSAGHIVDFTGRLSDWPGFLEDFVETRGIDTIFLYGDCRPVHDVVFRLGLHRKLDVFTFEEGYIRPHYVTLEKGRVNGRSSLPRNPETYRRLPPPPEKPDPVLPRTFWRMAWHGFVYHLAAQLYSRRFPHARELYHRGLGGEELIPQIRNVFSKVVHSIRDWPAWLNLNRNGNLRYFLVPLQVAGDFQVRVYSPYGTPDQPRGRIEDFITDVMRSFARHAPEDAWLVFKHHPMDRGYAHYGRHIRRQAQVLGIAERVVYFVKNVKLPPLIDRSLGVVVINSTVGLQAVLHGRPVKVLGEAVYDIPGLTAQCSLDRFWEEADRHVPDHALVARYAHYLKTHCLIFGSFFRPSRDSNLHCGLVWPGQSDLERKRFPHLARVETERHSRRGLLFRHRHISARLFRS